MSEWMIIDHCAPTLAGLKTGNLFSCSYESKEQLWEELKKFNRIFVKKGIRMIPLKAEGSRALIYLYRPQRLQKDMDRHPLSREILKKQGYSDPDPAKCIVELVRRLHDNSDFPHEIGLFLGYPPEDVYGFIEHKNEGCKCAGCWKVYGDEEYAQKCFASYKKCTLVYRNQFSKGKSIEQLTVAV